MPETKVLCLITLRDKTSYPKNCRGRNVQGLVFFDGDKTAGGTSAIRYARARVCGDNRKLCLFMCLNIEKD